MYLMIKNKGEMELEAITLMGATSKEGSDKIGFFGSGNKYAITTLLRTGHTIQIFSGLTEYKLTLEDVVFRGTLYQRVLVNDTPTSLTTRMGPAWEPWMAIREFYCNALDEGLMAFGETLEIQEPSEGETAIYVTMSPEIQSFLDNLGNYINNTAPLDSLDTSYGRVDILPDEMGHRYRKNIACAEPRKSLFSYNFQDILINESRILQYDYQSHEQMTCALAMTQKPEIITKYIRNCFNDDLLEAEARWGSNYCVNLLSQAWEDILLGMEMRVIAKTIAQFVGHETASQYLCLPDELVSKIQRDLPKVPVYGNWDGSSVEAEASPELVAEVTRTLAELESWGFTNLVLEYRKFTDKNTWGQFYKGNVYLSIDCPLDEVLNTLYEEYTHRDTGLVDLSRGLQDYLFLKVIALQREAFALRTIHEGGHTTN